MQFDVAIVGFGPVGALLANLLGQLGITTAVIERDREVYRLPRAVHFDHEIMRVFQSIGLSLDDIGDTAPVQGYEFHSGRRELLFRFDIDHGVTSQGWESDYMFHQPSLEARLRDMASDRESVSVYLDQDVVALDESSDHVDLVMQARDGGERRDLRATYVVGCDGANSFVRRQAGLELEDYGFDEPWLVVDAMSDLPASERGLPEYCLQLCDPKRPVTVIPVAGPYVRWEFMLKDGETAEEMLRPERVNELVAEWIEPSKVELIRTAVYDFHAVVAKQWNTKRVFLAGDSAHQMPPFLGQGMCSGMRDASNLGWKLAHVIGGRAAAKLLETYQPERDPHVRRMIELAISMGQVICTQDEAAAKARDEDFANRPDKGVGMPDLPGITEGLALPGSALAGKLGLQGRVRAASGEVALLDDVVGTGMTVLTRGGTPTALRDGAAQVLKRVDGRLVPIDTSMDVDGVYADWFDRNKCDAVLVRPDHQVFGAAQGESAASDLLEALGEQL